MDEKRKTWQELCLEASQETNHERLTQLINEITRLIDEERKGIGTGRKPDPGKAPDSTG